MKILLEQPLPILAIGTISVAIAIGGFLKTGHVKLVYLAIGIFAATMGCLLIERSVVTLKEQIETTLVQITHALEQEDNEFVLSHIASSAEPIKRQLRRVLTQYVVTKAKVKRNLTVLSKGPNKVTASVNAVLDVSPANHRGDRFHVPNFYVVDLIKEDGCWKLTSYERRDPREGLR